MTFTTDTGAAIVEAEIAANESTSVADLRLQPLTVRLKSAYGLGAAVDAFTNTSLTYFFFFYITAVCGLSGTLAGLSTFVALAVDAVADPAIGLWSDNSVSRFGRRHPFMLVSIFPLTIAFGLLFSIPAALSGWPLFAVVTGLALVLRFSLSLFLLPYIALGAELSDDYIERSTVVAYRSIFATLATFACFGLALAVYMPGQNGLLHRTAYIPFGWTGAALMLACGLGVTLGTRSIIARLHKTVPLKGSAVVQFLRELGEIFRNPSFVALFLSVLTFFIAQGTAGALTVHAFKYFWTLTPGALQATFFGLALGPIAGIPMTAWASRRLEKRTIAIIGLCVFCTSQFFMPVAKIAGILPAGGTPLFAIIVGNAFVLGAMIIALTIAFQSMLADAADEHEHLFAARREGMFFAGLTFSAKAAGGAGALIAGVALDVIHFPSNIAAQGAHLHLTGATIRNLGLVYGPLPALITLAGAMFLFRYRLTRGKHATILADLNARRNP
jgi:glycoside/pentoside/hexuronide:cation symporter, GPH family